MIEYMLTLGIVAMEGRGFEYPTDSVMGPNGRLYVPNKSRNFGERGVRLTVLDIESEFYGTFGTYGTEEGKLESPSAVESTKDGKIMVCDDYTHTINLFDLEGTFLARWGNSGPGEGELNGPSGIAVDTDNNVYISDTRNHRIQKFNIEGIHLATFGTHGKSKGQFDLPWGISRTPRNTLCIADWGNSRIQELTLDGEVLSVIDNVSNPEYELKYPSSAVIDKSGTTYIADCGNERVKVIDPKGNMVQNLRGEATVSKWAGEFLTSNVEENEARLSANMEIELNFLDDNDPHSESAHIEKYFWSPVSIKLDEMNRVYITETNRHRIQVYQQAQ